MGLYIYLYLVCNEMNYTDLKPLAQGNWKAILSALAGLSPKELTDTHQPCPACGGHDRYRFDDKNGEGSYYCNGCGAGDGIDLLCKVTGMDFNTAKDAVIGYLQVDPSVYNNDYNYRQPVRNTPQPISDRKQNYIDAEKATAWINKAEKIPFTEYTISRILSPQHLIGSEKAVVVPVHSGNNLVNCAAIDNEGKVHYAAGHFTYGGYSQIGKDEGKSFFICHDWGDSVLVNQITGCMVFCCWSPFNFIDAGQQIQKHYKNKSIYLALNKEKNELLSAEETGLKCVITSGESGYIDQDRKLEKKLYSVGELIDAL